ncbi:hypothetical protein I5677_16680 [Mobilitalea sibirica]|uniref:Uncharacterized protein n=1 Tax=Mobilitalea sibirica TaxID=1462919 RepID=A0A8J7HCP8_9FIRM|nr:hypothetical protein [Mobilitalea sibirica]MBH1942530.1 hypothetical protein [Mobilitalea sibirica]
MDFKQIIDNLAVGIGSGIFASIIVTVVFYIFNDFQKEIEKAKDMTYPLWGLIALNLTKDVSKNFEVKDVANKYFSDANINFERFEPWKFKYELHVIMVNIYELLIDGKSYNAIESGKTDQLSDLFIQELNKLDNCDRYFVKGFFKRIIKNKIIISACMIFLLVVFLSIFT